MELSPPRRRSDSLAEPVDRIGFELLRAIVGARQSLTPTVRAVIGSGEEKAHGPSAIDLLNGRGFADPSATGPSAFHGAGVVTTVPAASDGPAFSRGSGEKQ